MPRARKWSSVMRTLPSPPPSIGSGPIPPGFSCSQNGTTTGMLFRDDCLDTKVPEVCRPELKKCPCSEIPNSRRNWFGRGTDIWGRV